MLYQRHLVLIRGRTGKKYANVRLNTKTHPESCIWLFQNMLIGQWRNLYFPNLPILWPMSISAGWTESTLTKKRRYVLVFLLEIMNNIWDPPLMESTEMEPQVSSLYKAQNSTSLQLSILSQSKLLRSFLPLLGQSDNSCRNRSKYNMNCLYKKEKSRKKSSSIPCGHKKGFESRSPAANATRVSHGHSSSTLMTPTASHKWFLAQNKRYKYI